MESSSRNMVKLACRVTVEQFINGNNNDILHFSVVAPMAAGAMMDVTIYRESYNGTLDTSILTKGSNIFIKGYLQGSNYTSKTGRKVWKTVLVAERIRPDDSITRESRPRPSAYIPEGFHLI